MKTKMMIALVALVCSSSVGAEPKKSYYAGKYDLMAAYRTASVTGFSCTGVVSVANNANFSYSAYWPQLQLSSAGKGHVSNKGMVNFQEGSWEGKAKLQNEKVCFGDFQDRYGAGYFAMRRR